jgi:hypothetical protein
MMKKEKNEAQVQVQDEPCRRDHMLQVSFHMAIMNI